MKQFKEDQIVVVKLDSSLYEKGEIATIVKYPHKSGALSLHFADGFREYSSIDVEDANPEHFDFYEKVI